MDGTPKSRDGHVTDHSTAEPQDLTRFGVPVDATSPDAPRARQPRMTIGNRIRVLAPGLMTMGGLFLAFWSMALTAEGRYEAAVWAVFIAGVCDTFDGTLARALGVISPLGRQLDSLVDLVAAGVAPAMLIYSVYFESWGFAGLVVGFAWAALVALRLARFTTSASSDSAFFVGIPCPIAAGIVSQYLLFSQATFGNDGHAWICLLLVVGLGALMLSRVPYWKSTTLMPKNYFRYPYGPGTTVVLLGIIPFPRQSLFVGALFSIFAAIGFHTLRLMRTMRATPGLSPVQPTPTTSAPILPATMPTMPNPSMSNVAAVSSPPTAKVRA